MTETNTVVFGVSSQINNDTHKQKADESDDLDTAEPELQLAEDADAEQVHDENFAWSQRRWKCCVWQGPDSLKRMNITEQRR